MYNKTASINSTKAFPELISALKTILFGSILAFAFLLCYPLLKSFWAFLWALKHYLHRPSYLWVYPIAILGSILAIAFLVFAARLWRSLRLGLISLRQPVWALTIATCLILFDLHHACSAISAVVIAAIISWAQHLALRKPKAPSKASDTLFDPDLPVPEGGKDLLGRNEVINRLVSLVLREHPSVIALTGEQGFGKTSLLNLAVGELQKLDKEQQPIIVKFSPWLAATSNDLVISLLTSIVAQIRAEYLVRGFSAGALQYARALLSMVPKVDSLKELLQEPSQQERVRNFAKYIAAMPRRILVIFDDLDRMEAEELETIFKILRGSEELSSVTFVCSFHPDELISILRSTRRSQDRRRFIEKFFQVEIALPKIDTSQIKGLFLTAMSELHTRVFEQPQAAEFAKDIDELWESGADKYFTNLRRLKLFANKISYSMQVAGREVNFEDFIRLELIRDVYPPLYEFIYVNGEYFYDAGLAFETWGKQLDVLDKDKGRKRRAEFYDQLKKDVPSDKHYVFKIVAALFPFYAEYESHIGWGKPVRGSSERERRISHPRFFRQYFEFRAPSELFSQRDFHKFSSSLKGASEEDALKTFNEIFTSIVNEDFKRWHFMHLIEGCLEAFEIPAARGLCRGMAHNASHWSRDAFEFDIGIRCSYETLVRIKDSTQRNSFLRALVDDSTSTLYTLYTIWVIEKDKDVDKSVLPDVDAVKPYVRKWMRAHYLVPNPPSVYVEFGSIDPNQVLFAWRRLGPDAESDQKEYVRNLLANSPASLDKFLQLLFRPMMDDYSVLKPFFDFDEIATFVKANEDKLNPEKVAEFRERYNRERSATAPKGAAELDGGEAETA